MERPVFVALMALTLLGTAQGADRVAPQERVVHRVRVRGGGRAIGEVRIARRGDATVVETVLRTLLLRRVVGEIRDKELANWPPGRPGHDDALAYVGALEEARDELDRRAKQVSDRRDRTRKLLIEFNSSQSAVSVALFEIAVAADGDAFRVTNRRQLRSVSVSRGYVDRNMRLIVADSFGVSPEEAAALLAAAQAADESETDGTKAEPLHE